MERAILLDDVDIVALVAVIDFFVRDVTLPPEIPGEEDSRRTIVAFIGRTQIARQKLVEAQKG